MKLRKGLVTGLIALVPASLVSFGIVRESSLGADFERVSVGMSEQQVIRVMGRLGWTERCPSGPLTDPCLGRCVEAYVYPSSFAPLIPEYWVIWFDSDKRVVGKLDCQSP